MEHSASSPAGELPTELVLVIGLVTSWHRKGRFISVKPRALSLHHLHTNQASSDDGMYPQDEGGIKHVSQLRSHMFRLY